MGAQFIGSTVRLILTDPPNTQVRGTVKNLQAGKALTLHTGKTWTTYLNTGVVDAELVIPSGRIVEVEILRKEGDVKQLTPLSHAKAQLAPERTALTNDPAIVSVRALGRSVPVQEEEGINGKSTSPTVSSKVEPAPVPDDPAILSLTRGNGNGNEGKSSPKVQMGGSKGLPAQRSPLPLAATFDWKLAPPQVHGASFRKGATPRSQTMHGSDKDLNPASHFPLSAKWGPLTHNFRRATLHHDINSAPEVGDGGSLPTNGVNGMAKRSTPSKSSPTVSEPAIDKFKRQPSPLNQDEPSATLTAPFSQPTLQIAPTGTWFSPSAPASTRHGGLSQLGTLASPVSKALLVPKKPTRKERKAAKQENHALSASVTVDTLNPKADKKLNSISNTSVTTSILKQGLLDSQPKGVSSLRSEKKKSRKAENGDPSGWATEEATDIHDMGDFDFESNLSKFNKRGVFERIRQEDTTADEERLHNFNRKSRPGTAGGKNLHYSENVLASSKQTNAEQSSADDDPYTVNTVDMRRRASDRNVRQSRSKKCASRRGSGLSAEDRKQTASGSLADVIDSQTLSRVSSLTAPRSGIDSSHSMSRKPSQQSPKRSLKIVGSMLPCPCVSPVQMLEIEHLAISEFGMTEEMLTENAGRCIAQTALEIARATPVRDNSRVPLIVIIAGDTKTGSRAIAAARHLLNQDIRVQLTTMPPNHSDGDMIESVRRQMKLYEAHGGKITTWRQYPPKRKLLVNPDLILDAMLGMHLSYDDLKKEDQVTFDQLVLLSTDGTNIPFLSIDIPSGFDAATGEVCFCQTRFEISPAGSDPNEPVSPPQSRLQTLPATILGRHVLSLGAPKSGLVAGRCNDWFTHSKPTPDFRVADIGIPMVAWKRLGKKGANGIDFGGKWVASLEHCLLVGKE